MDADAPPGRRQRPAPQPAVGPTRLDALDGGMGGARAVGAAPGREAGFSRAPLGLRCRAGLLGGGAAQGEVAGERLVLAGAGEAQRLA